MNKILALTLSAVGLCVLVGAMALTVFDGESSASAKQSFCQSTTELAAAVETFDELDPSTATIDEIDHAADDVDSAWEDVVDDAGDWANAYDNPLGEAYDDLYWAVHNIPGDATVAESLHSLDDELAAFPSAFTATFDGSGCGAA